MNRPDISVVMPFAGSPAEAAEAMQALRSLELGPGDELILVDNAGVVTEAAAQPGVTVLSAPGERSPAHARNVGATRAMNQWILFLDADTQPPPGLLDAFWEGGIAEDVGAAAGEIVPAGGTTLAARYATARSFLGQQSHQAHPFRPRAAAANLLVRRAAFEQLGGFYEGVRAAEDTDFTWRLQEAGWQLILRSQAQVEHRYRTSLRELRRQWRGYAAGRAWLARRYDGFVPEPAVKRAARRGRSRVASGMTRRPRAGVSAPEAALAPGRPSSWDRRRFLALDALLSLEELAGLGLSNRPAHPASARAAVVLVADHFPSRDDPLVELADSLDRVRVEALGRPRAPDLAAARRIPIDYLEDDGRVARVLAMGRLILRHPVRSLSDILRRGPDEPTLRMLAPGVRRLERDPEARLHALGAERSRATAERLARLAGRPLD